MKAPITYIPKFIVNPDVAFKTLQEELKWVRRETTPRSEYYINAVPVPYTYGSGRGVRTYEPQPNHPLIEQITKELENLTGTKFEVCFLNRYHDSSDHLGWHADDSPEMDDSRPIAIVTLGAERDIMFCPQNNTKDTERLKLEHGSLCLMKAGMQDTHFHRIPKAGFVCGERISLTFRGYLPVK